VHGAARRFLVWPTRLRLPRGRSGRIQRRERDVHRRPRCTAGLRRVLSRCPADRTELPEQANRWESAAVSLYWRTGEKCLGGRRPPEYASCLVTTRRFQEETAGAAARIKTAGASPSVPAITSPPAKQPSSRQVLLSKSSNANRVSSAIDASLLNS
jgi:hypothetical protein